jgi:hypothetical protein
MAPPGAPALLPREVCHDREVKLRPPLLLHVLWERGNSIKTRHQEFGSKLGAGDSHCNPSYFGGRDQGIVVQGQPRQIVLKTLSQRYSKRAGGVAQVVENLDPRYENLGHFTG